MTNINYVRVSAAVLATVLAAMLLALAGARPAEAAFPGTNGKIVFESNRTTGTGVDNPEGDFEIFTINPDGTGLKQLTKNAAWDSDPAWSADGEHIAFASNRSGNAEIYTMDKDGSNQVQRTKDPAGEPLIRDTQPTWSPDGTQVAWVRIQDGAPDHNDDIYAMRVEDDDADGNGDDRRRLTKNSASDRHPAWSPDGTRIAFESTRSGHYQIHVMKAKPEGKKNRPRNLSKNTTADFEPDWSPDGTKIAFQRYQSDGGGEILSQENGGGDTNIEIYRMDKDGTNQVRLTQNQVDDSFPAWSPDGTKIAFTSYRVHFWAVDPTHEIWTMDSADSNPESQLTVANYASEGSYKPDWQSVEAL